MKVRGTTTQVRLDNFFKVTNVTPAKRKADDTKENDKKKAKAKGGAAFGKKFK